MSLASAGRFLSTVPSGKSWIAGSYGKCSYSFIRNCHTIYQDGYTFYKRSSFSTSLPAVVVITVFYYGPPNNCIARPHCGFNLHKPDGLCSMAVHTSSFVQFLSDCLPVIMVYCNILPNLLPIKNLLPQLLKMLPAGSCQLSLPSGTASAAESHCR